MLHTILPLFVPSLLGQGTRQSLFILIFYQFYNMAPKSLDEAAFIDGAGILRTFLTINLRMTTPALVVVFVFSFVWNWNETNLSSSYFGDTITTLPLALRPRRGPGAFSCKFTNRSRILQSLSIHSHRAGGIL